MHAVTRPSPLSDQFCNTFSQVILECRLISAVTLKFSDATDIVIIQTIQTDNVYNPFSPEIFSCAFEQAVNTFQFQNHIIAIRSSKYTQREQPVHNRCIVNFARTAWISTTARWPLWFPLHFPGFGCSVLEWCKGVKTLRRFGLSSTGREPPAVSGQCVCVCVWDCCCQWVKDIRQLIIKNILLWQNLFVMFSKNNNHFPDVWEKSVSS